jgi:hypothetical protein
MHYYSAIAYMQRGKSDNAKYILYGGIDGALSESSVAKRPDSDHCCPGEFHART